MAQPFSPSEFPAGERQLHLAKEYVLKIVDGHSGGLSDDVLEQYATLESALGDALAADASDDRLDAIAAARTAATSLRDGDVTVTLSNGIKYRVERLLDIAEAAVDSTE